MKLGDTANADAVAFGKPLDGVRILAARADAGPALRHPAARPARRRGGEGRSTRRAATRAAARCPAMPDPDGRQVGATFLRNNLDKQPIGVDLKTPRAATSSSTWRRSSTSCGENFKAGAHGSHGPRLRGRRRRAPRGRLRVGLGLRQPRRTALRRLAGVRRDRRGHVGHLRVLRHGGQPPTASAPWARSATSASALFATIGMLAALRHRDRTGVGQYVDIAMFDSMVAMTDIVDELLVDGRRAEATVRAGLILDDLRGDRRLVRRAGRPRAPVRARWRSSSATRSG